MVGHGSFGNFKIEGKFLNYDFTVTKDGQKVNNYILIY